MEINKRMEQSPLERRPSSMQVTTGFGPERERFEKEQHECITKAIKAEESPAKEKHVRRTIIGTWQERGCSTFWNVLGRMPLPSQNIMCWKAMMVFHKILREGHPNCMKDSYVFKRTLKDLYSIYRSSQSLYGQLIAHYLRSLQCKLEFHHKYHKIPGSLIFNDENPFKIPHRDINDVFHFAVEILDYQDLLLTLEEEIMKTLDKSKNNSQVLSAQCRIAPMVPLLKECSGLYDMLVHVMIKLHKCLPPDTLSGHRTRFNQQFSRLKLFIHDASSFAFITALTTIPQLPDSPPNFLIHTMEQPKQKQKVVEETPSVPIMPQKDDRDMLIEQLMREINDLREHLEFLERDAFATQSGLKAQVMKLKEELSQYQKIAEQTCEENVFLKSQLEGFTNVTKSDDAEKEKVNEMFLKLKQKYTHLRDEHVKMIRQNADLKRKAELAEQKEQEVRKTFDEREAFLQAKEEDIKVMEENFGKLEQINKNAHDALEELEQEKKEAINEMVAQLNAMSQKLDSSEAAKARLAKKLEELKTQYDNQVKSLQAQLEHMSSSKVTQEDARKSAEESLSKIQSDNEMLRTQLEEEIKQLREEADKEKTTKEALEQESKELKDQLASQVSTLSNETERLQKEKFEQEQARMELTKDLESLRTKYTDERNNLSQQIQDLQHQVNKERNGQETISKQMELLRDEYNSKVEDLSKEIHTMTLAKGSEETAKKELEDKLKAERQDKESKLLQQVALKRNDEVAGRYALIASTVEQCKAILKDTISQFNNPLHLSGTTCSAGYLKARLEELPNTVDSSTSNYLEFRRNEEDVSSVLSSINVMTHALSECLLHGKATSHMASHTDSEDMTTKCTVAADTAMEYLTTLKERDCETSKVDSDSSNLKARIDEIIAAATLLIPKESDNLEGVGDLVDEQINETAQLVADASARIEEMLKKSRKTQSGVQLAVNERILDSCNDLMKAIRELIMRSKDLQEEIVLEGKGTASAKEFYKRHHKWTEGLLSAAKSVGWGASIVVDAADKVVERKGKFEELVVASNEIAASTAQLVAASRVKASKGSNRLSSLMRASKGVGAATANVVAMVKSGAEMSEDAKTVPDYSKLTLTQAKRLEMDAQVRMLELETLLEKERQNLGRLRKAHYQIASELGLIEQDDDS